MLLVPHWQNTHTGSLLNDGAADDCDEGLSHATGVVLPCTPPRPYVWALQRAMMTSSGIEESGAKVIGLGSTPARTAALPSAAI